jgi:hypothetical protein
MSTHDQAALAEPPRSATLAPAGLFDSAEARFTRAIPNAAHALHLHLRCRLPRLLRGPQFVLLLLVRASIMQVACLGLVCMSFDKVPL